MRIGGNSFKELRLFSHDHLEHLEQAVLGQSHPRGSLADRLVPDVLQRQPQLRTTFLLHDAVEQIYCHELYVAAGDLVVYEAVFLEDFHQIHTRHEKHSLKTRLDVNVTSETRKELAVTRYQCTAVGA